MPRRASERPRLVPGRLALKVWMASGPWQGDFEATGPIFYSRWNHVAFIENGRAGVIKTAPASNTTNIKNSTYQKIATVIVAIAAVWSTTVERRGRLRQCL